MESGRARVSSGRGRSPAAPWPRSEQTTQRHPLYALVHRRLLRPRTSRAIASAPSLDSGERWQRQHHAAVCGGARRARRQNPITLPIPFTLALFPLSCALCSMPLLYALCPLPLPLFKTIGVVKMLLACKDVDAKKSTETGITPSHVACEFGHEYIVDLLSGCMDHNHDILARGSYPRDGKYRGFVRGPFEDSKDQDCETQWNGNSKQNLERSAVISPVEDNIPATRFISVSKAKKMSSF